MTLHDEASALNAVPPFSALADNKLKLLAFASQLIFCPAGTVVIRQGDDSGAVYVLMEGAAEVTVERAGEVVLQSELGRHAFFGELGVMRNAPRAATVIAVSDITLLKIPKLALERMFELEPTLLESINDHIETSGYFEHE